MKLFIKILLFVLVVLITNVKVMSAAITFPNTQEAIAYSSFHPKAVKTVDKIFENDLENCCQNGQDLVAYRNSGKGVEVVAAKGEVAGYREVKHLLSIKQQGAEQRH